MGVLDIEPEEFASLDNMIRQILNKYDIHLQPSCKERLYLPRDELGRGLSKIEHKSEIMLFNLLKNFESSKHVYLRRFAIIMQQKRQKTHFSLIQEYLTEKYKINEMNAKLLEEAQSKALYNDIKTKPIHQKLYNAKNHELVAIKSSSLWLKRGNM